MMKPARIITCVVLFAAFACEKKPYPTTVVENGAVFYFEGLVNGVQKRIVAGENNYYMYATHQNSGGLYQFRGDLKRTDCENCAEIGLLLNDHHLSPPGSGVSDSSLQVAAYTFAQDSSVDYNVNFTALFNRNAAGYWWDFGDGQVSPVASPMHRFKPGTYDVCLTITSDNGCVSKICNTLEFGDNAFRTQINAQHTAPNTILFSQSTIGAGPFDFYWSFGDGTTSTLSSPLHTYDVDGSYPVVLRVTDANGNTVVSRFNTVTGNDASSCAANFGIGQAQPVPSEGFLESSIKWKDDQGNEYHSSKIKQPADSYFEVTKVEEFEANENGQPTKKMTVKFSCLVSDGTKNIRIQNATAVISVAYP